MTKIYKSYYVLAVCIIYAK